MEFEIRRVNILNESNRPRILKLTSYGEVVLAAQATDQRHPAFNKLFIQSEYLAQENALLFQRRPRSVDEKPIFLVHAMVIEAGRKVTGDHTSGRGQFLGRSQTSRTPEILQHIPPLLPDVNSASLDPIFSLTQEIELKAHAKTRVSFLTLAASSRAEALEKLSHYQTGQSIHRAFDEARAASEQELLELGLNASKVETILRLFSCPDLPGGDIARCPAYPGTKCKGAIQFMGVRHLRGLPCFTRSHLRW